MPAYVDAVLTEALHEARMLGAPRMDTVFLGGGTPSTLPPALLERLLCGVTSLLPLAPRCEFTTEANPGTLTAAWLDVAVACGVNRLSMGMQALQPCLLKTLGRIHTFEQVEASVRLARAAGIREVSLDLMFGLPGQTAAQWHETLTAALSLSPQHLSCYGLIPEEGTPLLARLEDGSLSLPDEEVERAMYDDAIATLAAHGFQQYEISNFALPGHACRHNVGYWRQVPYLGLGASAASMLPGEPSVAYVRRTDPRTIDAYLDLVSRGAWQEREEEPISFAEARFETMMLGLRMDEGVSESGFLAMHGVTLESCYGPRLRSLEARGLLRHIGDRWSLTRRGMDIQNSVLVELMDD